METKRARRTRTNNKVMYDMCSKTYTTLRRKQVDLEITLVTRSRHYYFTLTTYIYIYSQRNPHRIPLQTRGGVDPRIHGVPAGKEDIAYCPHAPEDDKTDRSPAGSASAAMTYLPTRHPCCQWAGSSSRQIVHPIRVLVSLDARHGYVIGTWKRWRWGLWGWWFVFRGA